MQLTDFDLAMHALIVTHDAAGIEFQFNPTFGTLLYRFGSGLHFFHPGRAGRRERCYFERLCMDTGADSKQHNSQA